MSVFTITVQDLPIELTKTNSSGTISINSADQERSSITYTTNDNTEFTANINTIFICKPPTGSTIADFEIVFEYINRVDNIVHNTVYIQVPVKTGNVSPKFINQEFTEFMEDATANTFRSNLSELINALPDTKLYSDTANRTTNVIKTDMMYLNVTIPTGLVTNNVPSNKTLDSTTPVKIKTIAASLNFHKTDDYDTESKDPSRTKPITLNKDNLNTYTGLMIFCIVVGFIIATAYVIIIMIPDSKLHITKPPRVNGGGGWSLQKTWSNISHQFSKILSR